MGLRWGWACESVTLAEPPDETGTGATSVTAQSGAVCDTAQVKVGTNSGSCPTNQDYFSVASSNIWDNGTSYINSYGCWYWFDTWTAGENFWRADETAGPNDNIQLFLADTSGSGNISLFFRAQGVGDTTLTTTVDSLATDNWYFIEFAADRGNTKAKLSVYDTDGVQIGSTIENTGIDDTHMVTTQVDELLLGSVGNGMDPMFQDNMMYGDNYDDDHVANRNITDMADWGADEGGSDFDMSATALAAWGGESTVQSNFDVNASAAVTWVGESTASSELNADAVATATFNGESTVSVALDVAANALVVWVGEASAEGRGAFSMTSVATVTWDGESIVSAGFNAEAEALIEWVGEDALAVVVPPNEAQREPGIGGGYGWGDAANIKRIKSKKLRLILEDDEEFMEIVKKALPELLSAYRKNIH